MPLKKRKLLAKIARGTPVPAAPEDAKPHDAPVRDADPLAPLRQDRARRAWSALALSAAGLALVGCALAATLGSLADFKLDVGSWIPAIAQGAVGKPGRTNILVAGVGGHSNDAPWLTDSVMLVSVDPDAGVASFLSIPRDLYVTTKDFGGGKLNELYAKGRARWGEERGARTLMDKVSEITGEPVDKYVVADFDGFVQLVDLAGGIDVDVPEALTDTQYPDGNWGYETFSVGAGPHAFDGATALKYVRSRHSTSDFDRSRRQQLVLEALKAKLASRSVLTSPTKVRAMLGALSSHVWTDLSLPEMVALGAAVAGRKDFRVVGANLNDGCFQNGPCAPGALLYVPARDAFGGMSVVLPTESDGTDPSRYGKVRKFAYVVFHLPLALADGHPVRVYNSTKTPGLAAKFATTLRRYGFSVPQEKSAAWTGAALPSTRVLVRPDVVGSQTLEALGMWVFSTPETFGTGTDAPRDPGSAVEITLGEDAKAFLE